ncbi:unnamed protein product [Prorocentrum cordatum]|uniref:Uncharacterized protein n=1 Tax=Prorocentrum cordatum TaxID=2364126 RepID=A0ABN9TX16_9DINO|nr:unnamed protein product [Polarella glacialis]
MSLSFFFEVTQQEYLATLIVRCCISLSFCFLAASVWLDWGEFTASLHALMRSLQSPVSHCGACTSTDSRVLRDFNKARVARLQFVADTLLIPLSAMFMPLVICMHVANPSDWGVVFRAVFMCGRSWANLYWKHMRRSPGFTAVDVVCLFKVFMCTMALRMCFASATSYLMYGGLWSAARATFAIFILDWKTSVRWNILLSAVTCVAVWQGREQIVITDGVSSMAAFVHNVFIEVVTCALVCCASIFLEVCEKDRLKASLESNQSGRAYRAVQRLLGVLCDAQLYICPQLNIIAHSPHLVHLLGPEDQAGDTRSALLGCNFLRYVGESDQQRFQDFISATAALQSEDSPLKRVAASVAEDLNSGECAMGPATSIQVSLCKDGGTHPIPVELFLICITDAGDAPEFLMGIRETSEVLPREACTDAPGAVALQLLAAAPHAREPQLEAAGAPCAGELRPPPSAAPPRSEPPLLRPARRAPAAGQERRPQPSLGRRSRSSLSSSSKTSSTSSGSCAPGAAGCVSSVCLRLDSASRGLRVEDMVLHFKDGHLAPRLKDDWVPREVLNDILKIYQDLVNQREYAGGEEATAGVDFGAVRFSKNGDTFLRAECAELAADDPTKDPRDPGDDPGCFNPIVLMKLTGVSKFRMPWQKGLQMLPPIDESPTDAAGQHCGAPSQGGDVPTLKKRAGSLKRTAEA